MTTSAAAAFGGTPSTPAAPAAPSTPAAPASVAPPAAPAANSGNWYDPIENGDVRTWAQAKGFKDPLAATESAYNLEKLIGFDRAGRTLVLPKDDASPEEVKAFHSKLGVPDTPEGYKLPLLEGADPALVKNIQGWMHQAGATPKVAAALTEQFVKFSQEQVQADQTRAFESSDKAFSDTVQKWGKDADMKIELGKRFAAQLLPDQITLDDGSKVARGDFLQRIFEKTGATTVMMELFANAGAGLGEHKMRTTGDAGFGDMSPAMAQQKMAALKQDQAWVKDYLHGSKDKIAEMERLTKLAFPG